ncbi:protein TIFY 11c-like isoform X1 [Triticum dicoccoides]|uniref:protein TIFY 11c-like isoform X1 n=1 Tax=Triticum dicoccoides TaxID=85692 RepID=UPI00188E6122|nr:protein TIFY 11c-like isoform X1 [Triticum dicoccoides]
MLLSSPARETEIRPCPAVHAHKKERAGQDLTPRVTRLPPGRTHTRTHTYLVGPRRFLPQEIGMGAEQQQQQTAGGSRFAAAFGLLRQYMKDQPGGGVVTVGLMPGGGDGVEAVAPEERIRTMELFPQQAGMVRDSRERTGPERAPLTIFYAGRTVVFDDFPAEKAKELMQLAGSFGALPAASDAGAEPVCQNAPGQPCFAGTDRATLCELPIARKASLHRFLEKRKSRLAAADPYPAPVAAPGAGTAGKPVPEDGGAPWLGVNSALQLN